MEKKSLEKNAKPPHDPEARKKVLRRALRIGLLIWPIVTVLYWLFYLPPNGQWDVHIAPNKVTSTLALAFPTFSIALIVSILSLNTLPVKTLFKISRARLLGAVGLWLIMPLALFGFRPVTVGFVVFSGLLVGEESWSVGALFETILSLGFMAAIFFACYAVACLFSSGLPSRWIRFAAYCLFWWGIYFGLFLLFGFGLGIL